MPCCKCVEHGWANKLPGELEDNDGNKYCILHAPLSSRKDVGEFRRIIEDILTSSIGADSCQLSGVIFPEDVSLSLSKVKDTLPEIDLSYAVFYGDFNADGCTFLGKSFFTCTEFKKDVSFIGANFKNDMIFTRSIFRRRLIINDSIVKNLKFEGCRFKSAVNFNNMICGKDFSLSRCVFKQFVTADNARFEGKVSFNNARFRSNVKFNESNFLSSVAVVYSKFRKNCDFMSCTCESNFICRVTKFLNMSFFNYSKFNNVLFQGCLFGDRVQFNKSFFADEFCILDTLILKDSYFSEATFLALASFLSVSFNGEVFFTESIFKMKAKFGIMQVNSWGRCLFRRKSTPPTPVVFEKKANFSHAEFCGELYFERTTFNNIATFKNSRFISKAIFNNVAFKNSIDFEGAIISDIMYLWNDNIVNIPSDGEISFKNSIIITQVRISHSKLDKFNVVDVDLGKFCFYCCEWEKDKDGISCIHAELKSSPDDLQKLEVIYRSLKKSAIDNKDDVMASEWHYQEKTTCRKKLGFTKIYNGDDKFLRIILVGYEWCSGYGERPWKALRLLLYLIMFLFLSLLTSKSLYLKIFPWEIPTSVWGEVFSVWIKMLLFVRVQDWNEDFFYHFALVISRVFVPIQIALFTLSLRNKLRR